RSPEAKLLIAESMTRDRIAALTQIILAVVGVAATLVALNDRRSSNVGEFFALLTVAAAGMAFFVTAENLMTLFLGLEWFSIALYILTAMEMNRRRSLEAGLKYLIVGSFGSAILLFGCALTYGATGELGFNAIRIATGADDPLFVTGLAMILAGLAFKVSAAPFHMWTPDVYEGAPTSVTAFMSAATKLVAIVVTYRVLVVAFPEQAEIWSVAVAILACASLAIGNIAALAQRNVKRMLAYSSVSHAGFLLIAVAANSEKGLSSLLFYLIPYAAGSLGAFAVVAARERELGGREVTLDSLAGLGWERPVHGVAMWAFMLSFAGLPLTGGFFAKFYVFSAAFDAGMWWLVVVGAVATAVSLYYYFAIVRSLYLRSSAASGEVAVAGGSPPADEPLTAAILLCAVVTIGSFFAVGPLVDLATKAASGLF
ncbi:MAG: NADH-quinone oxidoreductase subunit N, partial [Actinobacteria bacterium]|nr:NADH-quinone oxidoreductase subunit N [Actinomycetota bacterium]